VEFRLGAQPLLGWLIIGPLAGYGVNKGEGSCATLGAAPVDYQPIFVSGCLRRQIVAAVGQQQPRQMITGFTVGHAPLCVCAGA